MSSLVGVYGHTPHTAVSFLWFPFIFKQKPPEDVFLLPCFSSLLSLLLESDSPAFLLSSAAYRTISFPFCHSRRIDPSRLILTLKARERSDWMRNKKTHNWEKNAYSLLLPPPLQLFVATRMKVSRRDTYIHVSIPREKEEEEELIQSEHERKIPVLWSVS